MRISRLAISLSCSLLIVGISNKGPLRAQQSPHDQILNFDGQLRALNERVKQLETQMDDDEERIAQRTADRDAIYRRMNELRAHVDAMHVEAEQRISLQRQYLARQLEVAEESLQKTIANRDHEDSITRGGISPSKRKAYDKYIEAKRKRVDSIRKRIQGVSDQVNSDISAVEARIATLQRQDLPRAQDFIQNAYDVFAHSKKNYAGALKERNQLYWEKLGLLSALMEDEGLRDSFSPPFVRRVVVTGTEGTIYDVRLKDRKDELIEKTEELKKLIHVLMWYAKVCDEEIKSSEQALRDANDRYVQLLNDYENGVYGKAGAQIGLEILDSAVSILRKGLHPGAVAAELADQLGELYISYPDYDFPNMPREILDGIDKHRGDPVKWAEAQLDQMESSEPPADSAFADPASPREADTTLLIWRRLTPVLEGIASLPVKEWDYFNLDDISITNMDAKLGPKLTWNSPTEMLQKLKSVLSAAALQEMLKGNVISVGTDVTMYLAQRELDETFMEAAWIEIEWLTARRGFHLAHAKSRLVNKRLNDVMKQYEDMLLDALNGSRRFREINVDEFLIAGEYTIALHFSRVCETTELNIGPLPVKVDHVAPGEIQEFLFRVSKDQLEDEDRIWTVSIQGHGSDDKESWIDANPYTVPQFMPRYYVESRGNTRDAWLAAEVGADRTHNLKIRDIDRSVSVLFLVDGSGSMAESNRIQSARNSVKQILTEMLSKDGSYEFSLWTFRDDRASMVTDFSTDATLLLPAVDQLSASGDTPLSKSIRSAGAHLITHGSFPNKILVILSDGENADSGSVADAERWVREQAENVNVRREGY